MYYKHPLSKPDQDEVCWHLGIGEFGQYSQDAFNKHLDKMIYWKDIFKHENGKQKDLILRHENYWYKQAHSTNQRANII